MNLFRGIESVCVCLFAFFHFIVGTNLRSETAFNLYYTVYQPKINLFNNADSGLRYIYLYLYLYFILTHDRSG